MFQITAEPIINFLQNLGPEFSTIITLICCYLAIIIFFKLWQEIGLYLYTSIALIACNLHVLKGTEFSWYSEPIALGTVIYASTFLVSDILTEIYGAEKAKKSVGMSFGTSILLLILMICAIGTPPLILNNSHEHLHFNEAHNALEKIFNPNTALLIASFSAYVLSQLTDIFIFSKIKVLTKNTHLWFRTFCAISVAALTDSIIFNVLAWKVFSPYEISWNSLILTYIVGAYILQMIVAFLNIPTFYLILKFIRR